jgi:quercetin dioxygenase-like cupin family protein/DNA-binding XRE family transcriptional regulator
MAMSVSAEGEVAEVVEPTLSVMLERYAIGQKLRALRLRRKMGLVELGKHTSLSPSLLSKIERGKVCPPLGTLLRISMVFSVGLDHFFSDDRDAHVVAVTRASERRRFPDNPDVAKPAYMFESLDFGATDRSSSSFLAHFEPLEREEAEAHVHEGNETIYLISGRLELTVGTERIELEPGDSVYFDSTVPHTYRRLTEEACTGVVVTVP